MVNTGEGIDYHANGHVNMDGNPKEMIRAGFTLKGIFIVGIIDDISIF